MIYIFEDRTERRLLHQELVNTYKEKICFAKFGIDEGMNLEDYIIENFFDAEIIIFHKSYSFKSKTVNLDEIRKKMPKVRFVIFSGGIEYGKISEDGNTITINADVMYGNLEIFIKSYNNGMDVNFEVLVWGEQYQLNQLLSFQDRIFREFFISSNLQTQIDRNEIEDVIEEISLLGEEYNVSINECLVSEITPFIETGLTWGNLLQIIHNLLNIQYK